MLRYQSIFWALSCGLFLAACALTLQAPSGTIFPFTLPTFAPSSIPSLVVIGDTQRTLLTEEIVFQREQNDREREVLIADIALRTPDALVMVGDLVGDGSSTSAWKAFDQLMTPIARSQISVLPAVGNHDYWGDARAALSEIEYRFPRLSQSHWYSHVFASGSSNGGVGLIWLDSNHHQLSPVKWAEQKDWYTKTLGNFEADSSVVAILVFAHHPPFTNSQVTSDDSEIQAAFVPAFLSGIKTRAFISGHTHSYERFVVNGKTFVVTGGGGGPRVDLLTGANRRHPDLIDWPAPRPFHYLLMNPEAGNPGVLKFTVYGLEKGETLVRSLDEFRLN